VDRHNLIGRRNARDALGPSSGMQIEATWRTCQQLIIDSNRKFCRLGTSDLRSLSDNLRELLCGTSPDDLYVNWIIIRPSAISQLIFVTFQ